MAACDSVLKSNVMGYPLDFPEILSSYLKKRGKHGNEASTKSGRPDIVGRPEIVSA